MKRIAKKQFNSQFRKRRNRAKIFGTAVKPRLSVFRSNRHVYAQLIDDAAGKTLAAVSSKEMRVDKTPKAQIAKLVGEKIAEKAKHIGIATAVFNKGAYKYHGRVRAVAEGARGKGLKL